MTQVQLSETAKLDVLHHVHPNSNLLHLQDSGPLVMNRGKGVHVYDENGKAYIEGLAGLWCASLGFSESRLVEAATNQLNELPYYHSFFGRVPETTAKLSAELARITPAEINRFFFAGSGSEAVDSAIKLTWYYNNARGLPNKKKIISRVNGYHGVTIGSASLTRIPVNREGFDLPVEHFIQTDCPHYYRFAEAGESEADFVSRIVANLEQTIAEYGADNIAAFIAEPIQGAGGIIVPAEGYFEKIQVILKKHDILFIVDEVICGFARTGEMFGSDTFNLQPDMMTMAKGLSAGYQPISALGLSDDIFNVIATQSDSQGILGHGFTYGGHPVAAAVALEALKIYRETNIVDQVKNTAVIFQQRLADLADHPLVGEVRGKGLIGALELVADKNSKQSFAADLAIGPKVFEICKREGLLFRNKGDTLLFCPPLIISNSEVNQVFDIVSLALDEITSTL